MTPTQTSRPPADRAAPWQGFADLRLRHKLAAVMALVLLATRWVSHDYQNVRRYCDQYGKPLVKLPAGYHPNQVAHQILAQAGHRLRATG